MGAMITIKYASSVEAADIEVLANGLKPLVEEAISENDVFVYTETFKFAVGIEPIEVFIQVNGREVTDPEQLTETIAGAFSAWKQESKFSQPINLNVIPVQWHFRVGL
jgi:hypothetical protein